MAVGASLVVASPSVVQVGALETDGGNRNPTSLADLNFAAPFTLAFSMRVNGTQATTESVTVRIGAVGGSYVAFTISTGSSEVASGQCLIAVDNNDGDHDDATGITFARNSNRGVSIAWGLTNAVVSINGSPVATLTIAGMRAFTPPVFVVIINDDGVTKNVILRNVEVSQS